MEKKSIDPSAPNADLGIQVAELTRRLDQVASQTAYVDHEKIAQEEHAALTATAQAGRRDAAASVKRYEPIIRGYQERAEGALSKLKIKDHTSMALERQLHAAWDLLTRTPNEWDNLVSSLAADDAKDHLPAIRHRLTQARSGLRGFEDARKGIGRLVAEVEFAVAIEDL